MGAVLSGAPSRMSVEHDFFLVVEIGASLKRPVIATFRVVRVALDCVLDVRKVGVVHLLALRLRQAALLATVCQLWQVEMLADVSQSLQAARVARGRVLQELGARIVGRHEARDEAGPGRERNDDELAGDHDAGAACDGRRRHGLAAIDRGGRGAVVL
mmetsp:Transcript_25231/g.75729  ORF Transcript_25231/g.75729 Transcript_25231/m.75729 type:complete len:158 (+) Transcript_25231:432-905(+)